LKLINVLVITFLGIGLTIALFGYLSFEITKAEFIDSTSKRMENLSVQTLDKIDREIDDTVEFFQVYVKDPTVIEYLTNSNKDFEKLSNIEEHITEMDRQWTESDLEEFTPFMKNILENEFSQKLDIIVDTLTDKHGYRVYGEIFVTNEYGVNVAQTEKTSDYKQNDESWWTEARDKGLFVGLVDYDKSSDVYSKDIAIRIENSDGQFLGVMKVVYNIKEFTNILDDTFENELQTSSTFELKLLEKDGRLIYSTDNFKIFDKIHDDELSSIISQSGFFIIKENGKEEFHSYAVTTTHEKHYDYGLMVIAEEKSTDILSSLVQTRNNLIILSLFIAGGASVFGVFISNSLTKPLRSLQKATKQITDENWDVVIKSEGTSEVKDLIQSFNEMIINQKKSKEKIAESASRFKTLYENSLLPNYTINKEGNIIDINPAFTKVLGYSEEDLIGKSVFSIVPERLIDKAHQKFAELQEKGSVNNVEFEFKAKDGRIIPIIASAYTLHENDSTMYNVIINDITEINNAKKLIQSQLDDIKNLQNSLDNSSIVAITDNQGTITYVNKKFEEISKYSKEELIGQNHRILKSEFHSLEFYENIWKTISSGKVWFGDIKNKAKDNSYYWVRTTITPFLDTDGKPEQYIAIRTDVTELYDIQEREHEKISKLNEAIYVNTINKKLIELQLLELKDADIQKDEFASMVSHELKTPLVPIKGYAEMLKDPDIASNLTPDQLEYANEIYDNAERLEALIADVLDVQKIAIGQMTFNKEKIIVGEFLTKIANDSTSLMIEKQIQFEVNQSEEITINCDKNRLHQVLDNLIRNAVDFVPKNTGKIEIGVTPKDDDLEFYVKDNGIGIPKDKQNKLFKKFYQVDTSQTRVHGGTGLGLVICKGIVEGLGGKMWVESDGDGKGTTFYFTLPKN